MYHVQPHVATVYTPFSSLSHVSGNRHLGSLAMASCWAREGCTPSHQKYVLTAVPLKTHHVNVQP